jgi:hypothetical protein
MPFDFLAGLGVEDQTEWTFVLPHFTGNVITMSELIGESVSICIEEDTTDTTQSFSSEPLY